MTDFSRIVNGLNAEEEVRPANINVTVVALGGTDTKTIQAGMSVAAFKTAYGLEGTKIVNESGETLENNAILNADTQVFVSLPKKNG